MSPQPTEKTANPTHVIVVEDAPHVHKALIDGCGVRMYRYARAEDEENLLRPGVVAFALQLPYSNMRSLVERLRDLLRLGPDAILTAKPEYFVARCRAMGVPVHDIPPSVPASEPDPAQDRCVRVLILDAAEAVQPTSGRALRAVHSEVRQRISRTSEQALPLRKLG